MLDTGRIQQRKNDRNSSQIPRFLGTILDALLSYHICDSCVRRFTNNDRASDIENFLFLQKIAHLQPNVLESCHRQLVFTYSKRIVERVHSVSSNETSVNHLYLLVTVRDHCAEHVLYRYPSRGKRTSGAELLLFSTFVEIQCDTVMLMSLMYIYIQSW